MHIDTIGHKIITKQAITCLGVTLEIRVVLVVCVTSSIRYYRRLFISLCKMARQYPRPVLYRWTYMYKTGIHSSQTVIFYNHARCSRNIEFARLYFTISDGRVPQLLFVA